MRQVVLDTETTGLDPNQGHRIIEIGCVELIDRRHTGRHYHQYINPQREIEQGAIDVHGITNEFLADKPIFVEVAEAFYQFIEGAELVIHNAPFDVGFINHEFNLINRYGAVAQYCTVLDTLVMARKKNPGQKNNLDALCRRLGIDNSHRELHGALLDAQILAEVYLLMSGGQTSLLLAGNEAEDDDGQNNSFAPVDMGSIAQQLKVIEASAEEIKLHERFMEKLAKKNEGKLVWK